LRSLLVALLLLCFGLAGAEARPRKRKPARAKAPAVPREAKARLDESLVLLKRACGHRLRAEVDWKGFAGKYRGRYDKVAAAAYCSTVVDGLRYLCEDGAGKRKVKRLSRVLCRYRAGANRIQLENRRGRLTAYYHWETPNIAYDTRAWLAAQ
jgi:hypothetical protein